MGRRLTTRRIERSDVNNENVGPIYFILFLRVENRIDPDHMQGNALRD
jgi:hypothetical protein